MTDDATAGWTVLSPGHTTVLCSRDRHYATERTGC